MNYITKYCQKYSSRQTIFHFFYGLGAAKPGILLAGAYYLICEILRIPQNRGSFCPCVTNCRGLSPLPAGAGHAALLCIAAAVTVFFVPVQKQQPQAQYLLKDNAGRLALYTPDGTGPLAQYDVYTRLLPEPDCLALQQGVSIYTEAELQQKLEDYGL